MSFLGDVAAGLVIGDYMIKIFKVAIYDNILQIKEKISQMKPEKKAKDRGNAQTIYNYTALGARFMDSYSSDKVETEENLRDFLARLYLLTFKDQDLAAVNSSCAAFDLDECQETMTAILGKLTLADRYFVQEAVDYIESLWITWWLFKEYLESCRDGDVGDADLAHQLIEMANLFSEKALPKWEQVSGVMQDIIDEYK